MFIFNKKKKIVVDCFTYNIAAYDFVPIVNSYECVPDWWMSLPHKNKDFSNTRKVSMIRERHPDIVNMRDSYEFTELYKRGIVIRSWCDLFIECHTNGKIGYVYSNGLSPTINVKSHYGTGFKNYHNIKLSSPWFLREKTGLPFLMTGCGWNLDDLPISILNGVTNFNVSCNTDIDTIIPIPKIETSKINIEFGRPLLQIIPLDSDTDFEFKCHYTTKEECLKLQSLSRSFFGGSLSAFKFLNRSRV
jgi:hypothetical protein